MVVQHRVTQRRDIKVVDIDEAKPRVLTISAIADGLLISLCGKRVGLRTTIWCTAFGSGSAPVPYTDERRNGPVPPMVYPASSRRIAPLGVAMDFPSMPMLAC